MTSIHLHLPYPMASVNLREKPLSDGTLSLVLDYYEHGARRKQTLKIYVNPLHAKSRNALERNAYDEAYRIAHIERNKVEKRLLHHENDIAPTYDRQASFLDYFEELAATRNHNWDSLTKHLRQYANGKLPFGSLTEEWVGRFQDYLSARMQSSTAHSYMGLLYTSFTLAVRAKKLSANPGAGVRKVRVKEKPPKYLTKEQVELLLQHRDGVPDWLVRAFLFSVHTGLRVSDVESLVWGDIQGNGVSEEGRQQFKLVKQQVKTGDVVQVPLTAQAVALLDELGLRATGKAEALAPVFELRSRSQLKRYVERWRQQAGVFFTFHSSRHSFGTALQTAGVDIYTTSRLMGHRSVTTTTRYAKVVDKARDQAIGKLSGHWG